MDMILVSNNLTDVPFDFLFTRSCGSTLADGLKVQKNCYNLRIKKEYFWPYNIAYTPSV